MEPAGLKSGWRSFTTSVFGGGGGGGGGVGNGGGGGGECLSVRGGQRLGHFDSFVSVEDEGPGEDVSLLENRPVDQKKLRKRSHGQTQKLLLEDSDIGSSEVTPSIERCQRVKPHPPNHHSTMQPNDNSRSITSSSSLKFQSNSYGTAGGELQWQEEGWTSSGVSAADDAMTKSSTDSSEQHSSVQKNVRCISNRARNSSFIDGILFTKHQLAKEPDLGNLIDFDNDGLNN